MISEKLNPKLWQCDGNLRGKVGEILDRVFISIMSMLAVYTNVPMNIDSDIIDIILCEPFVDLNVKIIIRPNRYLKKMDSDVFEEFVKFLCISFAEKYKPRINGVKVNIDFKLVPPSGLRYSLFNRVWINKPKANRNINSLWKSFLTLRYKSNPNY